jgi:hypothetical protein
MASESAQKSERRLKFSSVRRLERQDASVPRPNATADLDDRFHESNHIGRHHGFLVNPCVAATSLQFSLLSIRFEPSKRPTSRQSRQDVGGKSQGLALRPLRENDFPPDNGGAFHFAIAFRPAAAIRSQLTLMRRRPAIDP